MTCDDGSRPGRAEVPPALLKQADRLGIEAHYVDAGGRDRTAPADTIRRVVEALSDGMATRALPVARPDRATPAFDGTFERAWGLSVQLYGVRSARNWGHGDFTDLRGLLALAAEHGASAIGLNPLHALFDDMPERASPYSPNSRLFLNFLYIDVEAAPGFPGTSAAKLDQALAQLRRCELIDYAGVAAAKLRGLQFAFDRFRASPADPDHVAFEQFRHERAPQLLRFACFEFLRRQHRAPWWEWPEPWRRPDDSELVHLRSAQGDAIAFVEFVQWIAHQQLEGCVDLARQLGMAVGLYLDVAIGVEPAGFDAWNDQDSILRGFSIGAPPDAFNPAGQNWGLASFNAVGLAHSGFEPLRALLGHSMHYAGAIRLDHVLGLKRLYVIPAGVSADQGVYLRMPFEQLLAVVAQESVSHRCIVIGEDLGTVPAGLRDTLADWGIWRYHVLIFEQAPDGRFLAPANYARNALVTNTTHDLPTFCGWCTGADIRLRRSLGLDTGETEEDRKAACTRLREALLDAGSGPLGFAAVVRFMDATPSRLLMISIEDVLELTDQPNLPGTTVEHPNWQRRLPATLERMPALDLMKRTSDLLQARRRQAET